MPVSDEHTRRRSADERPAFYALTPGGWRDYWSLLHPPVHAVAPVVRGASAPRSRPELRWGGGSRRPLAFFLAMGIAAHALDELHGRPLRTRIPDACCGARRRGPGRRRALGIHGASQVSPWIWAFIVVGVFLVVAYNLELFGGAVHSDLWFALAWGAFPVLTAYFAQTGELSVAAVLVGGGVRDGLGCAAGAVDTGPRPAPTCQRRARNDELEARRHLEPDRCGDASGRTRVRLAAPVRRDAVARGRVDRDAAGRRRSP